MQRKTKKLRIDKKDIDMQNPLESNEISYCVNILKCCVIYYIFSKFRSELKNKLNILNSIMTCLPSSELMSWNIALKEKSGPEFFYLIIILRENHVRIKPQYRPTKSEHQEGMLIKTSYSSNKTTPSNKIFEKLDNHIPNWEYKYLNPILFYYTDFTEQQNILSSSFLMPVHGKHQRIFFWNILQSNSQILQS